MQSADPEVLRVYAGVSKAAWFDLVVDLARQNAGDELLDGPPLIRWLEAEMEPVRRLRRDVPISARARTGRAGGNR